MWELETFEAGFRGAVWHGRIVAAYPRAEKRRDGEHFKKPNKRDVGVRSMYFVRGASKAERGQSAADPAKPWATRKL